MRNYTRLIHAMSSQYHNIDKRGLGRVRYASEKQRHTKNVGGKICLDA